jgi:hypothetical protein
MGELNKSTNENILKYQTSQLFSTINMRHKNTNDPTTDEKAALVGTNGTPGSTNKFLTDSDPRNTNARTPSSHSHAESDITNLVTDLGTKAPNASYRTIMVASGSHIAARVAGTYMFPNGNALAISGTGTLYTISLIPIYSADFPSVNGAAPKLRIRAIVSVNNTAPTGNFTVGLYPVNSGAGGAALKIYTTGTLVSGSAAPTVTTPAGSSMASVVGSDFSLPADGIYCLAVVTTATVATSSLVHINAILQMRNA